MAIQFILPKTARFMQCNVAAVAAFNVPTPGKYNFNSGAYDLLTMQQNSIYFIERINVGATIEAAEYQNAIFTLPQAVFYNAVTKQQVFARPLPIVNFIDNQECNGWIWTDCDGQSLQLVVSGVLAQSAFLVGVPAVTLNIQVNIYDISDLAFIQQFRANNAQSGVGFGQARRVMGNVFSTVN